MFISHHSLRVYLKREKRCSKLAARSRRIIRVKNFALLHCLIHKNVILEQVLLMGNSIGQEIEYLLIRIIFKNILR